MFRIVRIAFATSLGTPLRNGANSSTSKRAAERMITIDPEAYAGEFRVKAPRPPVVACSRKVSIASRLSAKFARAVSEGDASVRGARLNRRGPSGAVTTAP